MRLEQGAGRICLAPAQCGRKGAGLDTRGAGRRKSTHSRRRRRADLRQKFHRRLSPARHQFQRIGAREPLLSADGGRRGARTPASCRRRTVEGADLGAHRQGQRHHARAERTANHLRGDRGAGRAHQAAGSDADQDQGTRPIYADRNRAEEPRRSIESHRQGRLRNRRRSARHALCRRQGLPGVRRQAQALRLHRHQEPARHPFGGRDRRQGAADERRLRNQRQRISLRRGRGRCR